MDALSLNCFEIFKRTNIIMPISNNTVIEIGGFLSFGFILLINILLSIFLKIQKDRLFLIVTCLIFFKSLDRLLDFIVFDLKGLYFHFFMLQVKNFKNFIEVLPILPFSFIFFSREKNNFVKDEDS